MIIIDDVVHCLSAPVRGVYYLTETIGDHRLPIGGGGLRTLWELRNYSQVLRTCPHIPSSAGLEAQF